MLKSNFMVSDHLCDLVTLTIYITIGQSYIDLIMWQLPWQVNHLRGICQLPTDFGGFASWFMRAEEVVHVWCSQVRSGQPGLQITEPPWILSLTSLGFAQGIHVSKLWQTGVNDIALCTILQWLIYIYIYNIYIYYNSWYIYIYN